MTESGSKSKDYSSPGYRGSFSNFNEMLTWLPQGHDKALKLAVYNALAILFLILIIIVMIAVHLVLEPFVRPLLWALLCGSALHPFKAKLMSYSKKFIEKLKAQDSSLTISLCLSPFNMINFILDSIILFIVNYTKALLFALMAVPITYLFINFILFGDFIYSFISTVFIIFTNIFSRLSNFENTFLITSLSLSHLICAMFWWNDMTKPILVYTSPFIWSAVLIHLMAHLGSFGLFLSFLGMSIVVLGIVKKIIDRKSNENNDWTFVTEKFKSLINWVYNWIQSNNESQDEQEYNEDETDSKTVFVGTSPFTSTDLIKRRISRQDSELNSDMNLTPKFKSKTYIYLLFWAFILAQLWFNPKLLYFVPVLLCFSFMKWFLTKMQNTNFVKHKTQVIREFLEERKESLNHSFFKLVHGYFQIGDNLIMDLVLFTLNHLTSLSVILIMFICILFASIFIFFQIYGESLHLVNLISNGINATINNNSELSQLMPEGLQGVGNVLDDIVNNAYHYGRDHIKNFVQNTFNVDESSNKTKAIEKQILEVWDRAYHLWLIRNTNETEFFPKKGPYDWNRLFNAFKTLDFTLSFNILRENIDTVTSVFDSIWIVLKGNLTVLFGAITAVISLLLGGGSALLNFLINFIVFTTALFYLLSSSGDQYKPVEVVNRLFPSHSQNKFGIAVEEAINGVFAASFKMMFFYGLYTWLIHTLFEVNIVYVPSVIAAMFGAVPFLGAYWASFPAILELWLVQGKTKKAFLMLLFSILPTSFVDSTIYSEIKGAGHPYLTGLAIAGGVFYLGFEGALFGPMLLCCLFVVINVYGSIIQENPDTKTSIFEIPLKTKKNLQIERLLLEKK